MSLARLIYYSAVLAGWAAFLGWLIAEPLFRIESASRLVQFLQTVFTAAVVGSAIGLGLSIAAGLSGGLNKSLIIRALAGAMGGGIVGGVGGLIGNVMVTAAAGIGLPDFVVHAFRTLGWVVLGLGIGVVDGLFDRSLRKVRNGLIGGGIGGLFGGLLFGVLASALQSGGGMTGRATGFVVLGLCIGATIGLVQVVLKDAWLTVVDGYRTGRQLILSREVTILGRGDHLPLPFLGPTNRDVEVEHLTIRRLRNGSFTLEDNQSRTGVRLNNQPVQAVMPLVDGDVIKFGTNFVRFNERRRSRGDAPLPVASSPAATIRSAPPPPPIKGAPPKGAPPAPPPKPAAPPSPPPRVEVPLAAAPPPQRPPIKPAAPAPPKPPPPPARSGGIRPPPPPPKK